MTDDRPRLRVAFEYKTVLSRVSRAPDTARVPRPNREYMQRGILLYYAVSAVLPGGWQN